MPASKSLPLLEVVKAGVQTTIQDHGRSGYLRDGVPRSGAMDFRALALGNALLGNSENTAGLEIPFHQFEATFVNSKPTSIVVVGPSVHVFINEVELKNNEAILVKRGDRLKLKSKVPMTSARTYLCCSGGLSVPDVMESKSTYVPGKFGGYQGRALQARDQLNCVLYQKASAKKKLMKTIESNPILRYIPHRSPSALSLTWIKNYLETSWKIDPQSNRMGLRLNPLNLATQKQKLAEANVPEKVLSQGTFFGVIQLTQDGTPIILGADAQTMGGYPIVGCVIEEDLWKCGQVLPQQEITLRSVSISAKKSLTPSKKRT